MKRSYSSEQREEALALSLVVGPLKAGRQLGIPSRTVASWRRSAPTHAQPKDAAVILAEVRSTPQVVARLWDVLSKAVDQLEAGLSHPGARLGDVARATDVLLRSHELLAGHATERSEVTAELVNFTAGMSQDEQTYISTLLKKALALSDALANLTPEQVQM